MQKNHKPNRIKEYVILDESLGYFLSFLLFQFWIRIQQCECFYIKIDIYFYVHKRILML